MNAKPPKPMVSRGRGQRTATAAAPGTTPPTRPPDSAVVPTSAAALRRAEIRLKQAELKAREQREARQHERQKERRANGTLLLVAALGAAVGLLTPVVTRSLEAEPAPTTECREIYADYLRELTDIPESREDLLPGKDGVSLIAKDPAAVDCDITPETFARYNP